MRILASLGLSFVVALLALVVGGASTAPADDTQRRITTIVGASANVGGASQISTEILEECIMDLPTNADLHPITDAESAYMTHINGDPNRNGSVKKFSATVELTYTIYQKKLVVVTTSSIEGTDPVLQEVGGRFNRSIRFTSNSENGDMYAGQKLTREYFYSNEKGATDDAMRRAKAWLQQKRSVVCRQ